MSGLLTDIGSLFTAVISYLGDVFSMIVAQPILLIFIGLALVGTVVAFAKRLIR